MKRNSDSVVRTIDESIEIGIVYIGKLYKLKRVKLHKCMKIIQLKNKHVKVMYKYN